jgi:hypothetical protein
MAAQMSAIESSTVPLTGLCPRCPCARASRPWLLFSLRRGHTS